MPPSATDKPTDLLLPSLGVALAYALVGAFARWFVLPPGHETLFFPAAGIALVAALVWGWRIAPAVLLGAMALALLLDPSAGAPGLATWLWAAWLGAGAALQALLGAWLLRRMLQPPITLDSPATIASFFGYGAVVAGMLLPTFDVVARAARDTLPVAQLPLAWVIGWAAQALGALVGAPVALALIGRPREAWAPRRGSVAAPLALAVLLLALAVVQVARWEAERVNARFERDASNTSRTVELRLRAHLDALDAMHGVYVASHTIDGDEFRRASADWLTKLPSVQALGFAECVAQDAVPAFEQARREQGLADFHVFARDPSLVVADDAALVVRQIEPRELNGQTLGLNVLSIAPVREAVARARDRDAPGITRALALAQSPAQSAVTVYRSVRAPVVEGMPVASGNLLGMVFMTLRMQDLLAALRAGTPDDLQVCLFDDSAPPGERHLAGPVDCQERARGLDDVPLYRTALPIGGRRWSLQVRPQDGTAYPTSDGGGAWLFTLAGLAATGLMGALLLIVTGRTRRTEAAVTERTLQLEHEVAEREATARALRDSEQRFRDIFNAVPLGVLYTDLAGAIKQPNARFAAMTGYSESELLSSAAPRMTHPDDMAEEQRARDALAAGKVQVARRRKRLMTRAGESKWVDTTMTLQRDEHGTPQRIVALVEDISEHLRLEEAERARKSAEASNQAKSEFLSRMSHELRTPLNAMLGFAQLLELDAEPRLPQRQAQWVAQIRRAGWHLLEMINDVLDLSRIEAGTLKLELQPLRLEPLLVESLALVEAQARDGGVHLLRGLSDDQGLLVMGDATRIKQILTNLLSNAIKYNRKGGEVVLATRRRETEDGPQLDVQVRDTGLGMSAPQLAQLFQPFNRLGRERGAAEGTGIGLVIAKLLAERLGGALSVTSIEGKGSTFTLTLPLAGSAAPAALPPAAQDTDSGYHRRQVLYIEDNEINVEVMRGIFAQRPQIKLDVATTGLDGLAAVRTAPPDLILLDMHLPDIDGMSLLQHLKADPRSDGIPVVIVSADALLAQVEAALQAGAVRYLTKPVSVEEMLAVVDEQLSQQVTRFG